MATVSDVLKKIKRQKECAKEGRILVGVKTPDLQFISSGNLAFDWAISNRVVGGGFPVGRITELYGDPSSGKSLLIAFALAEVQKMGGIAIMDDTENSYDDKFMASMGVDTEALIKLRSYTVQEHFTTTEKLIEDIRDTGFNKPILLALDSIGALATEHERKTGLAKVDMSKAKVIKQAMRCVTNFYADMGVCSVTTNHTIANVGATYGPMKTTPGGGGYKFHASIRAELRIKELVRDDKGLVVGVMVDTIVTKNKVTIPFRQCKMEVNLSSGAKKLSGLFDVLLLSGDVVHTGAGYYIYKSDKKRRRSEIEEELEVVYGGEGVESESTS